jgi:hypothetical protein
VYRQALCRGILTSLPNEIQMVCEDNTSPESDFSGLSSSRGLSFNRVATPWVSCEPSGTLNMLFNESRPHISLLLLPKTAPLSAPATHHSLCAYNLSGLLPGLDCMRPRSSVPPVRSGTSIRSRNHLLHGPDMSGRGTAEKVTSESYFCFTFGFKLAH